MNYRVLLGIPLAVGLLALISGCWDTKDINKRYLPAVMGISYGKTDKYRVVLQIPSVVGKTQILEKEAQSISKAIDSIRTDAEKSIDLVHLRLFMIDDDVARDGIDNIIKFAVRANDISIKGMVSIVSGDFEETMYHQISPTPEISSYDYFSEEAGWTPNVSIVRIWEAFRTNQSYAEDMAIPLLKAGKQTLYTFEGSGILRDARMVGTLTPEETLLYNIFKGKYTGGTLEISKDTSVIIRRTSIHHHKKWTSEGPQLQTDIGLKVVVSESSVQDSDSEIEEKITKSVNQRYVALLKKLQALNADILGTGLIFRPQMSQQNIEDWKVKWFPHLKQTIKVSVNVQNDIYFKQNMITTPTSDR